MCGADERSIYVHNPINRELSSCKNASVEVYSHDLISSRREYIRKQKGNVPGNLSIGIPFMSKDSYRAVEIDRPMSTPKNPSSASRT